MRLKHNPKAKDIIDGSDFCIKCPEDLKDRWGASVSSNMPIFLEIGCGKGQFLLSLSRNNPYSFYIGLEQYESVLYSAVNKVTSNPEFQPSNLAFICNRAEYLMDYFSKGEISGIYLNFSDPWPKKRHSKRRLTSSNFLDIYLNILKPGGTIEFKTDNYDLFCFSMESFSLHPSYSIINSSEDLYSDSKMLLENVPTEYEEKFHSKGYPIYKIVAKLL